PPSSTRMAIRSRSASSGRAYTDRAATAKRRTARTRRSPTSPPAFGTASFVEPMFLGGAEVPCDDGADLLTQTRVDGDRVEPFRPNHGLGKRIDVERWMFDELIAIRTIETEPQLDAQLFEQLFDVHVEHDAGHRVDDERHSARQEHIRRFARDTRADIGG